MEITLTNAQVLFIAISMFILLLAVLMFFERLLLNIFVIFRKDPYEIEEDTWEYEEEVKTLKRWNDKELEHLLTNKNKHYKS
jgi:hypothetical protein